MTSTLGRLLINEADGEYNPNNYADTKMSEVKMPDADRKLDKEEHIVNILSKVKKQIHEVLPI